MHTRSRKTALTVIMAAFAASSLVVGCGGESAEHQAMTTSISDAVSITQRADGYFDVVCKDGRREVVTREQVLRDNVCLTLPPIPGSRTVTLLDRRYNLGGSAVSGAIVEEFGKGLWEGYLSFKAHGSGERVDHVVISDAYGQTWTINGNMTGPVTFARLPLPVTIRKYTDGSVATTINLTEVSAEITRVNSLPEGIFRGMMDAAHEITVFGDDLSGVTTTFWIAGRFFHNFTAGTRCAAIAVRGSDTTVSIDAEGPSRFVTVKAPVHLETRPTCQSSRLPAGENPKDFEVMISQISFGDPT